MDDLKKIKDKIGIWGLALSLILPLPILLPQIAGLFCSSHYFTGCFENIHDQNIYFSFIRQARDGEYFFINAPCHIPHNHEYVNFTFLLVGLLSRFSGASMELSYIFSDYIFSVAACLCLFVLFAAVFEKKLPIALGVCFAWFGAGFGLFYKIYAALKGISIDKMNMTFLSGDLWMPEMTLWHSCAYSPLFIASYLMLLLIYGGIYFAESKRSFIPLLIASFAVFYLALSHSYHIVPVSMISLFIFLYFRWEKRQAIPEWCLLAGYVLFAASLLSGTFYQYYVLKNNPGFSIWAAQNINKSPPFYTILAGFGVMALGYIEAFIAVSKERKTSGHLLKILAFWLFFQTILLYSPFAFARRFILGIAIPLSVFFSLFIFRIWALGKMQKLLALFLVCLLPITFLYQSAANCGKLLSKDSRYFYSKSASDAYKFLSEMPESEILMGSLEESNRIMRFSPLRMICASTQQSAPGMREAVENAFALKTDDALLDSFMKENNVRYLFLNKKDHSDFISSRTEFLNGKKLIFENNSHLIYEVAPNEKQ